LLSYYNRLSGSDGSSDTAESGILEALADASVGSRRKLGAGVEVGALGRARRSGGVRDGGFSGSGREGNVGELGDEVIELGRDSDGGVVGGECDHSKVVAGGEVRDWREGGGQLRARRVPSASRRRWKRKSAHKRFRRTIR